MPKLRFVSFLPSPPKAGNGRIRQKFSLKPMNWRIFSNRCVELLGDNLVGIYLLSSYATYEIILVLKQRDKEVLRKVVEIGNFRKDKSGEDRLIPYTTDELREISPLTKIIYLKHSKTIYGESLTKIMEVPSKKELSSNLLRDVILWKLQAVDALVSFEFWNEIRKRRDCYFTMKQIPRLLSAFYFIRDGEYPISRVQLKRKGDPDLTLVCDLLDKYFGASLQEIEKGLWASLSLLSHVEEELGSSKIQLQFSRK